jgi:phenylacetic acid degradation protein
MNWKIEGTRTYQALTVRSLATMVEAVALDAVEPDRRRIDVPQLLPLSDLKRRESSTD